MKRGGPLRRKKSLRQYHEEKIAREAKAGAQRIVERKFGKRTPLKKIAKSTRRKLTDYLEISRLWLLEPEHKNCEICTARQDAGEPIQIQLASEVHHKRGRAGKLLTDQRFFVASCRACRDWPHVNPAAARAIGILSSAAEWNVYPR